MKILAANYHFGHQFTDVTEQVKSLLRDHVSFTIDPEWLGVDPHPGKNKGRDIFREVNGKFAMLTTEENADVSRSTILKKSGRCDRHR